LASPEEWGFGGHPDNPVHCGQFGFGRFEADLKTMDLAQPTVMHGIRDSVLKVSDNRGEAGPLLRVHTRSIGQRGMFVLARRSVGPPAGAQFQLA
jgi:hypothetical protein